VRSAIGALYIRGHYAVANSQFRVIALAQGQALNKLANRRRVVALHNACH
jgi:hypothetical protein